MNTRLIFGGLVIVVLILGAVFFWKSQQDDDAVRVPRIYQNELNESMGDPVVIPDKYLQELEGDQNETVQ